jgi:arylsulfatase A-like enzyme
MAYHKLSRRDFLNSTLSALGGVVISPFSNQFSEQVNEQSDPVTDSDIGGIKPNVVFIMADQLRACSVGCYGNSEVNTPSIDGLSVQGAQFSNAVSTSPLCTPFRGCLMTGLYPPVTGVITNGIPLPSSYTCLGEVFRDNGYMTQYIGKWHLNGPVQKPTIDPGWVPPENRQGFTKWNGFNYAHLYYGSHYYLNNSQIIRQVPVDIYEPDWQTQQAINFINANKTRKFFLFLSIGTPHEESYLTPPPGDLPPGGDYFFPYDPLSLTLRPNVDYPDSEYTRQQYADYYGIISNFDWNVGRIISTLDSLGIANNTILVVTSDHGDLLGSHNKEYRHFKGKSKIEAEVMDIPFILKYPAKITSKTISDVFTTVDMFPTLLGLCKLPIPLEVMGRDFSPLLQLNLPPIEPPHGPLPSTEAILVGMWDTNAWVGVRTPEYTLQCLLSSLEALKLYHNTQDPYQMANLIDNPDYQVVKDELYNILLNWLDYIDTTQTSI